MRTEYLLNREVDQVLGMLTDGNRLALQVEMHTGLRIGDVLSLRRDQIKRQFWVTEAKTGKRRQVGLPDTLVKEILAHSEGSVWAFPGRRTQHTLLGEDKHRTRQAVWRDVKRAAAAYRMKTNVGTHSFRKVYAVDLMRKYGDIERVQRALKHSSYGVTMIYAMADKRLFTQKSRRATVPRRG